MEVFPAVDIKGGQCVRLRKGRMEDATVYNADPAAQALEWEKSGAEIVHIVDLDGAVGGGPKNADVIKRIAGELNCGIEAGGGIRSLDTINEYLEAGVRRVILGTAAVKDRDLLLGAVELWGPRVLVGVDANDGKVAVEGWVETTGVDAVEFCLELQEMGVRGVIFTDIERDGMLTRPNFNAIENLARKLGIPVIASGGVSCIDDIRRLKEMEELGIEGVIAGKALYDGRLDLREALAVARGSAE